MHPRKKMTREIRERYRLDSPGVLFALEKIPRENFVPQEYKDAAYDDAPIPIGYGQTISQPYTVAFMTDLLSLKGGEKVLEIGTGSGYQAAVLSLLSKEVYSMERIKELAERAEKNLKNLGFGNVFVKHGQGEKGWIKEAPFDAIMITAGIRQVPRKLFEQLKKGGVLVAPLGKGTDKKMTKFEKKGGRILKKEYGIFHFVPLIQD